MGCLPCIRHGRCKKKKNKSGNKIIEPVTQRFRGYALRVTIGNNRPNWKRKLPPSELLKPTNIIMLFRDLELLCQAVMEGDERLEDYKSVVSLHIDVAPVVAHPPFQLDISEYFSELAAREGLLDPFRQKFRDMPRTTITGIAKDPLIHSATQNFSRYQFEEPDALIESWTAEKARGTQLFLQRNDEAIPQWAGVRNEIDEAHKGCSWSHLLQKGGTSFVSKVAELYYIINLNPAHIVLNKVEQGNGNLLPGVQQATESFKDSRKEGYRGIAHSWKPSEAQEVKETLRYAKFLRLSGSSDLIPFATAAIGAAAHFEPDNADVLEEKRKIAEWKRRAGPVDESASNNMINGANV
jgi:hypothetical protein